jgi:hypothetical protein
MNTDTGYTYLLWLITKNDDDILEYLSEVSVEKFKEDIRKLVKKSGDKELIKQAIESLKKYL